MGGLALVAVVEPDELVAMDAVEGEDDHHDEVGDEQADVEGVPAVVAAEGAVGVMGLPVVREAVLIGEEERERVEVMCQGTAPQRMSAPPILREGSCPTGVLNGHERCVFSGLRAGVCLGEKRIFGEFSGRVECVLLGSGVCEISCLAFPWQLCARLFWRRFLPWADRVAQQNALFEEYYQAGLKNSPERATSLGDYRYNNLLSQHSLKAIADEHAKRRMRFWRGWRRFRPRE